MNSEQVAAREAQLSGNWWRRWLQSVPGQILANTPVYGVAREMVVQPEWRVLEIGCGAGSRLLVLDQSMRLARTAAGVEPSLKLAATAQRAFGEAARPLSPIVADPAALPFGDGVFDLAVSVDLLRFLDVRAAQATLREAARVLRPGALLLAWEIAPPEGRFAWWQRLWSRGYGGRLASARSLMSLAERSGFTYTRDARRRPFFWPPVPRASFVAGVFPEGAAVSGEPVEDEAVSRGA